MKIVIIGGAGFIGINASYHFLKKGHEVVIVDNLSRPGSEYNLKRLQAEHSARFYNADIRDFDAINKMIQKEGDCDAVLLLAGQVAVTTSVTNPRLDFDINALGTFNVLEAIRLSGHRPLLIYTSTNKVYGKMEQMGIVQRNGRYEYADHPLGIDEGQQLDFYSPYGCSKGCGDQYVRDYHRIYGLPTVVFRQSCIYGPNQFGIEDQGWVAWFTIATLLKKKFTIYGDGNQIRDILFVDDLVDLYEKAILQKEKCAGEIYNVGGGPAFTMSLNELVAILNDRFNENLQPEQDEWRPGDQKVYVSNIAKVTADLGWKPATGIRQGIDQMADWIAENQDILAHYVFGKPL